MSFVKDSLSAMFIYTIGDTIASLIEGEFSYYRILGMMLVAGTLYTIEIPRYFIWIDKVRPATAHFSRKLQRTLLAVAFFNPLWVTRHLAFIQLSLGHWQAIQWHLLSISTLSFIVNLPVSLTINYLIQNRLALQWRFIASSLFSAVLAVYYALSEVLFGDIDIMAVFTH